MHGRLRRSLVWALLTGCLAAVVAYQTTRPLAAAGEPRVFVPSPVYYEKLPESWQLTVADTYWLYLIQYYGEHIRGDYRFDSLPELLDLVTTLSPHWERPYLFGAYALLDMDRGRGRPDLSYELLERGYAENPDDWRIPFNLGIFAYWFGAKLPQLEGQDKDQVAAQWMDAAAKLPGHLPIIPRLAADLYSKGDDTALAVALLAQAYTEGDDNSKAGAVADLKELLRARPKKRQEILDQLKSSLPRDTYDGLVTQLSGGEQ